MRTRALLLLLVVSALSSAPSVCQTTATTSTAYYTACKPGETVTVYSNNVYRKPVALVKCGESVTVLGTTNGWLQIRTESGLKGIVSGAVFQDNPPRPETVRVAQPESASVDGTVPSTPAVPAAGQVVYYRRCSAGDLPIFRSPTDLQQIAAVKCGEPLTSFGAKNGWTSVRTTSGVDGFAADLFLGEHPDPRPAPPQVPSGLSTAQNGSRQTVPSASGVASDDDDDRQDLKFLRTVRLPDSYDVDFQLGLQKRNEYARAVVNDPVLDPVGRDVITTLVNSPGVAGLPYQWRFDLLSSSSVNASSTPDGQIVVNVPLAKMLGDDRGMWAAALSHEVAHTARRHAVYRYMYELEYQRQLAYFRARAYAGDKSANWAIIGLRIGYGIGSKKLARDMEHDADKQGMLLMAQAGYHPDFVFALHKMLVVNTGEQSKFAAFFSDHPRWATRDERSQKAYDKALTVFSQSWPDASSSPGGSPPTVAFLGKPTAREDKQGGFSVVTIPLHCRNVSSPVNVDLRFVDDAKRPILTDELDYRNDKGELELARSAECPTSDSGSLSFNIPASAVKSGGRKLKTQILIFDSKNRLIEESKSFDVKLPKVK